jgi:hypothetical protein
MSPPNASEFDRPVQLRVACMSLRHKMMYVDERHAPRGMVDDSSDTRIYWCTKTQDALGPDGQPVSPSDCAQSRQCYCRHG